MTAVKYATITNHLEDYCHQVATKNEVLMITRQDKKNLVMLSLSDYNALLKAANNIAHTNKINRSLEELATGKTVSFSIDTLEALETMTAEEAQSHIHRQLADSL